MTFAESNRKLSPEETTKWVFPTTVHKEQNPCPTPEQARGLACDRSHFFCVCVCVAVSRRPPTTIATPQAGAVAGAGAGAGAGAACAEASASAASEFALDKCVVQPFVPLPTNDPEATETEALEVIQWVIDMMHDRDNPHGDIPANAMAGRVLVDQEEFWLGREWNVKSKMVRCSCPTCEHVYAGRARSPTHHSSRSSPSHYDAKRS